MRQENITPEIASPDVKEVCTFLSDYAAWLCGCGATCIRIEKNVYRMAAAFGKKVDMSIMPSHIILTGRDLKDGASFSLVHTVCCSAISFDMNTRLSKLSWDVADGKSSYAEALSRFEEIKHTAPANKWLVLVLASLANASFCRLFGGDPVSMLVVFISTFCGYRIKQMMLEDKADVRFVFVCASFFSAVISAGCHLFGWGDTPGIALGCSVLYLVPGIPYINSASDMLDGHYLCAFSRFMNGMVLTVCLSLGLICGLIMLSIDLV